VLTQLLFYYSVYFPLYQNFPLRPLAWLMLASVCIAAAGYIINDYFDLNIDRINKPGKNVINSVINRRWALVWHLTLSFAGIFATALAVSLSKWYLIIANICCVILLWLYSTSFKRQLLIGNIVISLLTAWTVLILFYAQVPLSAAYNNNDPVAIKFFRIAFLYAGFAFIISLIREAIKDIQDINGDALYGCNTLPIFAGIRATKIYISVWMIVLAASLIILQLYILQFRWFWAVAYSVVLVIIPLLYILYKLFTSHTSHDFGRLSSLTKMVMLTGIFSMIFFRLYF
jgi:4-hydroxybenzoate polyprenyltransferase